MAEDNRSNSTPFLAFVAAALVIAVAVLGFFLYTGGHFGGIHTNQVTVDIHPPKMPSPKRPPG